MEWSGVGSAVAAPFGDISTENHTQERGFEPTQRMFEMTVRKGTAEPHTIINEREPLPTGAWALTMPPTTAEMKPKNQLIVTDRLMPVQQMRMDFAAVGGTQVRDRRTQQPHFGVLETVSEMPVIKNVLAMVPSIQSRDRRTQQQPHFGATRKPVSEMQVTNNKAIIPKKSIEGFASDSSDIIDVDSAVREFYNDTHVKARRFLLPSDFSISVSGGNYESTLMGAVYLCEYIPITPGFPDWSQDTQDFLEAARLVYVNRLFMRINDCYSKWRRTGWKDANEESFGKSRWIGKISSTLETARTDRDNLVSGTTSWFPTMANSFQTHLATRMGDLSSLITLAYTTMALKGKPVIVTTVKRGGRGGGGYILLSRGGQTITAVGIQYKTSGGTYTQVSLTGAPDQGLPTFSYVAGNIYTVQAYVTYTEGTESKTELGTEEEYDTQLPVLGSTSYTAASITFRGTITSEGGSPITETGIVYGASSVTDETFRSWNGTGATLTAIPTSSVAKFGSFSVTPATGTPGTYKFATYAVNGFGRSVAILSNTVTFAAPTLGALTVNVTSTTATLSCSVTANNGTITQVGFVWGTSPNSSTNSSVASVDSFTATITLARGSSYYFRAYATNQFGTAYSAESSYTLAGLVPELGALTVNVTSTSQATASSSVTNTNGTVNAVGFVWGTSQNPVVSGTNTTTLTNFSITPPTTLNVSTSAGNTYYFRAFATNEHGTGYSAQVTFTAAVPTVRSRVSFYRPNSSVSIRIDTNASGYNITACGSLFSDGIATPTTNFNNGSLRGFRNAEGNFGNAWEDGFNVDKNYSFRAYATNLYGTGYSDVIVQPTGLYVMNIVGIDASGNRLKFFIASKSTYNNVVNMDNTYGTGLPTWRVSTPPYLVLRDSTSIQEWTVPFTGLYKLTAWGADGGKRIDTSLHSPNDTHNFKYDNVGRGRGAIVSGVFHLFRGDTIFMLVGQVGRSVVTVGAGGGGGGTYIVKKGTGTNPLAGTILLIAGGGGGSPLSSYTYITGEQTLRDAARLMDAIVTDAGAAGNGDGGASGNGKTDDNLNSNGGGGGGGFATNGGGASLTQDPPLSGRGGRAFINGGTSGQGVDSNTSNGASGGQGGGGASGGFFGGGGGGFKGGRGGVTTTIFFGYGGTSVNNGLVSFNNSDSYRASDNTLKTYASEKTSLIRGDSYTSETNSAGFISPNGLIIIEWIAQTYSGQGFSVYT